MKLGYVILYVPDVARAVTFYEKAFGLKRGFSNDSGDYAQMDTGGTALAFASEALAEKSVKEFRRNRPNKTAAGAEVGLVTDDVDGSFGRAVNAGAVAVLPPTTKPWGQIVACVRDLNGVLVEICSEVSG